MLNEYKESRRQSRCEFDFTSLEPNWPPYLGEANTTTHANIRLAQPLGLPDQVFMKEIKNFIFFITIPCSTIWKFWFMVSLMTLVSIQCVCYVTEKVSKAIFHLLW